MEQKDTQILLEELKLCPDFTRYYDENRACLITGSLSSVLAEWMDEKKLKKADVIRRSDLNEMYAYQIFQGKRIPDRKKLLCLAFGMNLTLEETQKLLKAAGYAPLYVKLPFDCIVIYGLVKGFTVLKTNELLFEYGLETLG